MFTKITNTNRIGLTKKDKYEYKYIVVHRCIQLSLLGTLNTEETNLNQQNQNQ